jgi:hypothetical protein
VIPEIAALAGETLLEARRVKRRVSSPNAGSGQRVACRCGKGTPTGKTCWPLSLRCIVKTEIPLN